MNWERNNFEIIDDKGVIHSGTEDKMQRVFSVMIDAEKHTQADKDKYCIEWTGDLKLVEVHHVYK